MDHNIDPNIAKTASEKRLDKFLRTMRRDKREESVNSREASKIRPFARKVFPDEISSIQSSDEKNVLHFPWNRERNRKIKDALALLRKDVEKERENTEEREILTKRWRSREKRMLNVKESLAAMKERLRKITKEESTKKEGLENKNGSLRKKIPFPESLKEWKERRLEVETPSWKSSKIFYKPASRPPTKQKNFSQGSENERAGSLFRKTRIAPLPYIKTDTGSISGVDEVTISRHESISTTVSGEESDEDDDRREIAKLIIKRISQRVRSDPKNGEEEDSLAIMYSWKRAALVRFPLRKRRARISSQSFRQP